MTYFRNSKAQFRHIKRNEIGAREGHLCHGTSTKNVSWHFTAPSPLGQPLPLCFLFRTTAGRALILPGWASSGLGAGYLACPSSCLAEEWMAAQEHIPGKGIGSDWAPKSLALSLRTASASSYPIVRTEMGKVTTNLDRFFKWLDATWRMDNVSRITSPGSYKAPRTVTDRQP